MEPKKKSVGKKNISAARALPAVKAAEKPVARRKKAPAPYKEIRAAGLELLRPPAGAHKPKKLLGRGPGSGHGKTSTRGSKGQTSRAGRDFYAGFEGGQTPLIRRIPKRGFTSRNRLEVQIVNIKDLDRIKEALIGPAQLAAVGLIRDLDRPVKILGTGELKRPITVQAQAFSRKAKEIIAGAGGKVEIVNVKRPT